MVALEDDRPLRHLPLYCSYWMPVGPLISSSRWIRMPFWYTVARAFSTTLPFVSNRGAPEEDVERLPFAGGLGGDHLGRRLAVECATLVGFGLLAVGVQNLNSYRPCIPTPLLPWPFSGSQNSTCR